MAFCDESIDDIPVSYKKARNLSVEVGFNFFRLIVFLKLS